MRFNCNDRSTQTKRDRQRKTTQKQKNTMDGLPAIDCDTYTLEQKCSIYNTNTVRENSKGRQRHAASITHAHARTHVQSESEHILKIVVEHRQRRCLCWEAVIVRGTSARRVRKHSRERLRDGLRIRARCHAHHEAAHLLCETYDTTM